MPTIRWLRAPKSAQAYDNLKSIEQKAASGLTDAAGGAAVPQLLVEAIQMQAKNVTSMRNRASVISVSSGDVKVPIKMNNATSAWVGETGKRARKAAQGYELNRILRDLSRTNERL